MSKEKWKYAVIRRFLVPLRETQSATKSNVAFGICIARYSRYCPVMVEDVSKLDMKNILLRR